MRDFSVHDDRRLAPFRKELHDVGAFARELPPAGFGFEILLESAMGSARDFRIDLREAAFGGAADRVMFSNKSDFLGAFREGRSPDGEKRLVELAL